MQGGALCSAEYWALWPVEAAVPTLDWEEATAEKTKLISLYNINCPCLESRHYILSEEMVLRRCCCFPVSQVCGLLAVLGGLGCSYRQTWERCLTVESSEPTLHSEDCQTSLTRLHQDLH